MNFKTLYLLLAVIGAIVPVIFFISWIQLHGFDLYRFMEDAFVNGASSGLTADLLVSSVVFWVAAFELWRRDRGPVPWPFILANLCIGLSFALPLYLFVRHLTRPVHAL
jgi:hypothetical protein